ncbi:hypothetical protein KPL74_03015 [Bacillus sp. NP157]|nr:hypothetical protein KPL74_03015 [Bacillus sp. NP157]
MDDRTYLLGKLAALESALEAAISTHPEPAALAVALCEAMASYHPTRRPSDIQAFAEGWMAIVTPLLSGEMQTPVVHAQRRRKPRLH